MSLGVHQNHKLKKKKKKNLFFGHSQSTLGKTPIGGTFNKDILFLL
jgi:hypothetical protein